MNTYIGRWDAIRLFVGEIGKPLGDRKVRTKKSGCSISKQTLRNERMLQSKTLILLNRWKRYSPKSEQNR